MPRRPDLQVGREFRHVRISDDDVKSAIFAIIGMRLVARIDDRALDHRIEIDKTLEEVRPLRDLIIRRAGLILCADFPCPGIDRSRHKERRQDFHNPLKGNRAGHQIVFVIAVAVALAVGVVLVQHEMVAAPEPRHVVEALGEDPLADALDRPRFLEDSCIRGWNIPDGRRRHRDARHWPGLYSAGGCSRGSAVPALPRPRTPAHRAEDFHFHSPRRHEARRCRDNAR